MLYENPSQKAQSQCMNANDSYPVGVLSKSNCKITTKDKVFLLKKVTCLLLCVKWERDWMTSEKH